MSRVSSGILADVVGGAVQKHVAGSSMRLVWLRRKQERQ